MHVISDWIDSITSSEVLESDRAAPSGLLGSAAALMKEVAASRGAKTCFPFACSTSLSSELPAMAFPFPFPATGAALAAADLRFFGGSSSEL